MSILVVGSVALDTVRTPFGVGERQLGGSAVYFSAAASLLSPVSVVGVIGADYPEADLEFLARRGVDLSGIERAAGDSFFWEGVYAYDLNHRDTLETRLGVFAEFRPRIPEVMREADFVFLGNIDPVLQLEVLDQVRSPRLVVCDTMNYWIEGSRDALMGVLRRADVLMVNDSEIRQLAGEANLLRAARWVREHGPSTVVVKKGEHGAMLFSGESVFFTPGYPLEEILDPTGAGDSFAGGFLGYLAHHGTADPDRFRRAMVYGSVAGSYAVEAFSVTRFRDLALADVLRRVRDFREMTSFDLEPQELADD